MNYEISDLSNNSKILCPDLRTARWKWQRERKIQIYLYLKMPYNLYETAIKKQNGN